MLYFPIIRGNFPEWFPWWAGKELIFFRPVFNLADASITTGVFILLVFQGRFFSEPGKTGGSEPGGTSEPIDTSEPGGTSAPVDTSQPEDTNTDEQAAQDVPPEVRQN